MVDDGGGAGRGATPPPPGHVEMSLRPCATSATTGPVVVARGFAPRANLLADHHSLYARVNKQPGRSGASGANGANIIVNPGAAGATDIDADNKKWLPLLKKQQQESTL